MKQVCSLFVTQVTQHLRVWNIKYASIFYKITKNNYFVTKKSTRNYFEPSATFV